MSRQYETPTKAQLANAEAARLREPEMPLDGEYAIPLPERQPERYSWLRPVGAE